MGILIIQILPVFHNLFLPAFGNLILLFVLYLFHVSIFACMYLYMHHIHIWYLQRSKEGTESPEQELQKVVSLWVLGTQARSSAEAASAPNLQDVSLTPLNVILHLFSVRRDAAANTWRPECN